MPNQSDKLFEEFSSLTPSGLIELYTLDATEIGGDILYFYDGTGVVVKPDLPNPSLVFQGITYTPMPVSVKGFEFSGKGELPRPSVTFSNVFGTFTALSLLYNDLIGAKLIRRRTLRKFLDDGTEPNPDAELPQDIFFIDRKVTENKLIVSYELGTTLDVEGITLPRRQVTSNICLWRYRGAECGVAVNYFVSDFGNNSYPVDMPLVRYRGLFDLSATYNGGDCVNEILPTGDELYYKLNLSASNITGISLSNDTYWTLIQRYRGLWKEKNLAGIDITYFKNDVVYTTGKNIRQFYIFTATSAVGILSQPPNTNIWAEDRCGKLLSSCKIRQDPLGKNLVLTFGAFPGTATIPPV